ncbi:MAG TPA: hypothetical protein VFI44_06600 [Ornithinibacter sp.]|nr:hypothetical protein [Ornithinibacter sp.]
MVERARAQVARRSLLSAATAAVALSTGACGIRLEDDAPRVPFVPTRTPVAAEAELVALTRDTRALADAAAGLPGDLAADLATIHRRQHSVLRTTLVRRQVPADELDAAPSPTGSPTAAAAGPTSSATATPTAAGPSASPSATPATPVTGRGALAADEAAAAAEAGTFAGVEPDLRATVAALHAQRYAAATLLSGRAPSVPTAPVDGTAVAAMASLTSGAIFLVEVVAARSDGKQRARADATLAALRDLRADQLAGGAVADEALGHPLPFPVDSPADAARLARDVLTTLRAGSGGHLDEVVTVHGAAGLAALTRWMGAVEVEAYRWGVPLVPVPGLD